MKKIQSSNTLLLIVIVFAFAVRLFNLNYNSLFLDEAIYIRLGKEFFAGILDSEFPYSWVGGFPAFYPAISASIYEILGLFGSRFVNVILGTVSVYLVYIFVNQFKFFDQDKKLSKITAVFAALFFAIVPISVFLSRIAIYDMLSFTLFLAGLIMLQKAVLSKKSSNYYYGSAITLLLSFLAKYTVIIFFPFITLVLLIYIWKTQKKFLEEALVFCGVLLLGTIYYIISNLSDLIEFISLNVADRNSVFTEGIAYAFFASCALWYVLSVMGLIINRERKRYLAELLILFSLVPLIAHLVTRNQATLQQDIIFTVFFLAPLIGVLFGRIYMTNKKFGMVFGMAFALLVFFITTPDRIVFEHHWPNSTSAMNFLLSNASKNDKILAEADDVAVISLERKIAAEQISGPYNFTYKELEGNKAFPVAIIDKYFDFIQLDQSVGSFEDAVIPKLSVNYKIVYQKNKFTIYQLKK